MLIPLICSFGALIFDGLPRFFLLASPLVDTSSLFSFATTTTFFAGDVVSLVFEGRPRPFFGLADLILAFVEPADLGGRPRPFLALVFVDDRLFSPSSK